MGPGSRVESEAGALHWSGQADVDVTSDVFWYLMQVMSRLAISPFTIRKRHHKILPLILRVLKQTQRNPCSPVQHRFVCGSIDSVSSRDRPHSSRSSE